jgi:hypothetical protein
LERILGFGNGTIHRWSKASPTIENIKTVADYFGINIDYLICREEPLTKEGIELARTFDLLLPDQKDLVKCYVSIVSNNHALNPSTKQR